MFPFLAIYVLYKGGLPHSKTHKNSNFSYFLLFYNSLPLSLIFLFHQSCLSALCLKITYEESVVLMSFHYLFQECDSLVEISCLILEINQ